MSPRCYLRSPIFHLLAALLLAQAAHAQATSGGALGKTDFGKSQNTAEDLANSLVPGKPNLTKGEKKAEVDPKTLQSKKINDPVFEGGLNDLGLDWSGDKIGKPKTTSSSSTDAAAATKEEQPKTKEASTSAKAKADAGDKSKSESANRATADKSVEKEKSAPKTERDH